MEFFEVVSACQSSRQHWPQVSANSVNEIVAKRMNKKQQMRWNRNIVQLFLDVLTAVLNETLEDAFRHRYPGFRSPNDNRALSVAE